VALALLLGGCGTEDDLGVAEEDLGELAPTENWNRDVVSTDLEIDVGTRNATAHIVVDASTRRGASFEVGGLAIDAVAGPDGEALKYRVVDGRLDIGLPARQSVELAVQYRYELQSGFEGALASGLTFLWPHFCGNLFPCKSTPADGVRFGLELAGVADDKVAVYPKDIPGDAPSYMIAWAIGAYEQIELGQTSVGTRVSVYHLPGEQTVAASGTDGLVAAFDWYERTYGSYLFGSDVGSVSVAWGPGAYGGMEHHPFWHIGRDAMGDFETHVHEAGHGWFGNGVRIRCWEDLTLSEGTATYITARAIEASRGAAAATEVWDGYDRTLDDVIASEDRLAWPEGCNEVDVLGELWNSVPYMKGAYFYRGVEAEVGREALDRAIARFYAERKGTAAGVQDMLDTIRTETGFDAQPLATGWLRSMGRPDR
jgi:hypothetical protein